MRKNFTNHIDSIVAALIGGVLIILYTNHNGLGISPDSIYYTSASDAWVKGNGWIQFDQTPLVMFPVGYPFLLGVLHFIFPQSIIPIMPFVNALLFAIVILLSGVMLEKINLSKWFKWILLLLIVFSPTLIEIYSMLWSETLFIVEILVFIFCAQTYFTSANFKNLLMVSLVAAIATITRFAGVTLIMTGGLLLLLDNRLSLLQKIKELFIFGCVSSSLLIINLSRNLYLTNTLTGIRQKGQTPFATNLKLVGEVIADWLPGTHFIIGFSQIIGAVFIITLGSIFLYRIIKGLTHSSYEKIAATFSIIFAIFMLVSATLSRYEPINSRLMSPLYIPFLFTLSFYGMSLIEWLESKIFKKITQWAIYILSLVALYEFGVYDQANYVEVHEGGIGSYSDDDWAFSPLLKELQVNHSYFQMGQPVYSNASHAVYFYAHENLSILPEKVHSQKVEAFNQLPQNILIWFYNEENFDLLSLEEIKLQKNLTVLKQFKDGIIFQCAKK
jgi:hypothetical protein